MDKLIAAMALYTLIIIVGVLTMIHGWGLEPKSWGWIIGAGVFGQTVLSIMQALMEN